MNIQLDNPIISYSEKGKPFLYDKLFLRTVAEYIEEYKNVPYERLTDKDRSVALARIIKKMECNGVPVTEFFKTELAQWEGLENSERISRLLEVITKDMFCCFDRNLDVNGEFAKSNRIYYIMNDGKPDYIMYSDTKKKGLFGKEKAKSGYHVYFEELKNRFEAGELPKSSDEN